MIEMVKIFSDCSALKAIPDISNWDLSNTNNNNMFQGCQHDFLKEKIFSDDYGYDDEKNNYKLNIKVDKNKIVRNDDLKFFPQIELKFNNVENITKELIDNIKSEIRQLLKTDNFSIIEIKKGSLIVILSLQFVIFDELKKQKDSILDFNLDNFANKFSEDVKKEVKKVATLLNSHEFISLGKVRPDYIDEDIVDISDENNKNELIENINSLKNNDDNNEINLYEIGKINELEIFYTRLLQDADLQEKNQIKLIKDMREFNELFDEEIEEALKRTYFEFKIIHICLVDKEKEYYISEKEKCENKIVKILFHGTQLDSAISIISDQFRYSRVHNIGIGIYFTDLLDYAWNYTRINPGYIPRVGESFSFVASEVYYDNSKSEFVYNYNTYNDPVQKNGVRCCYGFFNGYKVSLQQLETNNKPIGQEYLITDKSQILPLYTVTVKRLEYIIIWRDYNFNSENPNNYSREVFRQIENFHRKIKKIISRELDSKIYYTKTTEEALDLIERKKYNKIFIITNGSNRAKDFIKKARKIIGANVIVAVSVYNIPLHLPWIKTMKNTLLLNGEEFHYKFLKAIMNKNARYLYELKNEINDYYFNEFPDFRIGEFNDDILRFPKFKNEANYHNDLTFNRPNNNNNCQIF